MVQRDQHLELTRHSTEVIVQVIKRQLLLLRFKISTPVRHVNIPLEFAKDNEETFAFTSSNTPDLSAFEPYDRLQHYWPKRITTRDTMSPVIGCRVRIYYNNLDKQYAQNHLHRVIRESDKPEKAHAIYKAKTCAVSARHGDNK